MTSLIHAALAAICIMQACLTAAAYQPVTRAPAYKEPHEMTLAERRSLCFEIDSTNSFECDPYGDISSGAIDQ